MLFYTFNSKEERRKNGGSDLLEIQFCKRKPETKIQKLVSLSSINHWQDDSLYVKFNDIEDFVKEYRDIFGCGLYSNLKTGLIDIHGINYYGQELVEPIMERILEEKTTDYETLIGWLYKAKYYNGFYILGI